MLFISFIYMYHYVLYIYVNVWFCYVPMGLGIQHIIILTANLWAWNKTYYCLLLLLFLLQTYELTPYLLTHGMLLFYLSLMLFLSICQCCQCWQRSILYHVSILMSCSYRDLHNHSIFFNCLIFIINDAGSLTPVFMDLLVYLYVLFLWLN